MVKYRHTFSQAMRRISPSLRERGRTMKKFADQMGLVYFGLVNQHEDDHSAIRGFTASLTHVDTHYTVGTYKDFDLRLTDRLDILHIPGHDNHQQITTILEVDLDAVEIPHVFFVPTGQNGSDYARLFATQPHLTPLNSYLGTQNHSPEFHGRYQILSRTTHSHHIERLFSSPIVVGIGARFWPLGIEIHNGKLFVYITEKKLKKATLEAALTSALWLAEIIEDTEKEK